MTHFVRKLILACLPLLLLATWSLPAQAASSPKAKAPARPLCVVHSNGPTVETGEFLSESSVADVIQVECRPIFSQQTVTVDLTQLFNSCAGPVAPFHLLSFIIPALAAIPPVLTTIPFPGPQQVTLTLDNDGNATVVVFAGPSCAPATARIFASLNAPPFPTASTTFTVLPPQDTTHGVFAAPRSEVEDAVTSSVATVIQAEFPSTQAERLVTFKSDELAARCGFPVSGLLFWFAFVGGVPVPVGVGPESAPVPLDNNGNVTVVAVGGPSCASGASTITAELTTVPFTTFSTNFAILSPRPTV